jgi:outer membrane protein assembly factor BamD (BamD/ComL family)
MVAAMIRSGSRIRLFALLLAGLGLLTPVRAMSPGSSNPSGIEDTDLPEATVETSDRKNPSVWHRPDRDNPADQLAWARELRAAGKLTAARKQFNALVHEWHHAGEAPQAQLAYAELLLEKGKHVKAFDAYQYLVDYYAGQFPHEKVLDEQFRIANTLMSARRMKIFGLPGFDISYLALPRFRQIVENGRNFSGAAQAQFNIGLLLEKDHEYKDASDAYERVERHYANSGYASEAAFRRAACLVKIADRQARDESSSRVAMAALSKFLNDHTESPNRREARETLDRLRGRLAGMYYERALFYDRKSRRPRAAVIAYTDFLKHFPSDDRAPQARQRVETLQKELENNEIR